MWIDRGLGGAVCVLEEGGFLSVAGLRVLNLSLVRIGVGGGL